jgi:hypothetical protein
MFSGQTAASGFDKFPSPSSEWRLKTSHSFHTSTLLTAGEDFIETCRRESCNPRTSFYFFFSFGILVTLILCVRSAFG